VLTAWPHQPRQPHRGDADGHGVAAAEQLGLDRGGEVLDTEARHDLDRVERSAVARDAGFGLSRATLDIIEAEAGHPPLRALLQVVDRRVAALELRLARARACAPALRLVGLFGHAFPPALRSG